jgi:Undecaprenyl-phosphate glucose phosphotransferase
MFSALERFSEWPGHRLAAAPRGVAARNSQPASQQEAGLDRRRTRLRSYHLLLIVWAADILTVALACIASRLAAVGARQPWHVADGAIVLLAMCLSWACFAERDMSHSGRFLSLRLQPARLFSGWLNAFGLLMLLLLLGEEMRGVLPTTGLPAILSGSGATAGWMLCLFASGLAFLLLGRLALVGLLSRVAPADLDSDGMTAMRAVVVGSGMHGAQILADLQASKAPIRVLGLVDEHGAPADPRPGARQDQDQIDFRVNALRAQSLTDLLRRGPIDTVVLALPRAAAPSMRGLVERLSHLPVDIWLAPDFDAEAAHALQSFVGNMPLVRLRGRPLTTFQLAVKKLEDMVAASLLLALAAPLMLVIALAIKLESSGPVMFRQTRRGYNERLIGVLKFRTMYADKADADAARQTVRGDERVTRVGRVLRRFSLDELPQLINVLRGEMSVVGPRPHALQTKAAGTLFDDVVANYGIRHKVKPGITGWAQINGWRGETDTVEKIVKRVEFDIDYIENWSLRRDLAIMFRTAFRMVADREAY